MRQLFGARFGLVVVAAVTAQVAGPSFGAVVDKDPFKASPGWKPPVLVSQDHAHRETSLAISLKDPDLQIVCAPSGVPNTSYKQSYFHLSHDGGRTWEPEKVEGDPTDTRNYTFESGDCDVAFDRGGTIFGRHVAGRPLDRSQHR